MPAIACRGERMLLGEFFAMSASRLRHVVWPCLRDGVAAPSVEIGPKVISVEQWWTGTGSRRWEGRKVCAADRAPASVFFW